MKRALLLLGVLTTLACTDTLSPRPMWHAAAPSFSVTGQYEVDRQSVILPSAYAGTMGESNNIFPHSWSGMRYQQVFLGSELGGLRALGGLCLRRDDVVTHEFPGQTKQLAIKLGPTQLDHTSLGRRFDDNYSSAPTIAFSGDVTIPASSGGGTPTDFYICVDFATPYIHPSGSNLIVEIVNSSATAIPSLADACTGVSPVPGIPPNPTCTTARAFAFDATASDALLQDRMGLIMRFSAANPSAKDDCKDSSWESFGFANQGLCIQFVETGKDSR